MLLKLKNKCTNTSNVEIQKNSILQLIYTLKVPVIKLIYKKEETTAT